MLALAAVGLAVLVGCSTAHGSPTTASPVAVRIGAAVREPLWSDQERALFALTGEHRIAKIEPLTPSTARTTLSAPFPDVGEDLANRVTEGGVYLPQPQLGRIAVIRGTDLRQIATLPAGPAPSYLALDSGSDDLLALSADRASVTPVDLHDDTVLPATDVHAGPAAAVDGSKRGRRIDYHLAGPRGITHYEGSPGSVRQQGTISISAETAASDLSKPSRLYVAQRGTDRLLAVDSQRTEHGLEVVAQARLGEPVRYLGVDETRIYAATEHELVVLKTNSFEGYHDQEFPIVTTIDFRSALPDAARDAALSGLAVGPDRVYLTLQDQPYLLSIVKPSI